MEEEKKIYGVYENSLLNKTIRMHIQEVGSQIKMNLENKIKSLYIGKCIPEGFIKPNSIKIINCQIKKKKVNKNYIHYITQQFNTNKLTQNG